MEAWERDLHVEKRLLLRAARVHALAPDAALSLHWFASSRAHRAPVRLADRSFLTETAEEIADAANYLRWEIVRNPDNPEWQQVADRVLGDLLLAWSSLTAAADIASDMGVPNTGFPVTTHGETVQHP